MSCEPALLGQCSLLLLPQAVKCSGQCQLTAHGTLCAVGKEAGGVAAAATLGAGSCQLAGPGWSLAVTATSVERAVSKKLLINGQPPSEGGGADSERGWGGPHRRLWQYGLLLGTLGAAQFDEPGYPNLSDGFFASMRSLRWITQ